MQIDCRNVAYEIYENLKQRVDDLKKKGVIPRLAVILIGDNPASVSYVRQKKKWGEYIGAEIEIINYPINVSNEILAHKIGELNAYPKTHAILIQRPVPSQIDEKRLELLVDPKKDIDGFHPDSEYTLPLPLAVVKILEEIFILKSEGNSKYKNSNDKNVLTFENFNFITWLKLQKIVVVGKGPTGGGPIKDYLSKLGVEFKLIDSKTKNPDELTKNADIIISAAGKPGVIKKENIKQGAILIGAGIFRDDEGKLRGDYIESEIENKAGYYTKTPGGVGPVNVAMLMDNLLKAAEKSA